MTDRVWSPDEPSPGWPVHETTVVWETPYFAAGYDTVERPDGELADYYWVHPAAAALAVPVTDDGEVVLVEQYRPRQRQRLLSCPGGLVHPGEDPVAAAGRELREETGFEAGDLTRLSSYVPSGWTRYRRHVVAATGLSSGASDRDAGEFIDVHVLDPGEAIARVREPPVNGAALTPLLLAREEGLV